jgi:hypothetical protein
MDQTTASAWAHETFSRARLGDPRRTCRLIRIAAAAAQHPAGTVTGTKQNSAGTEGTFRFLESEHVSTVEVAGAVFESTASAARTRNRIFVPVDQTDLSFVDRKRCRGLGPNHSRHKNKLRGVQVTNALALDCDGVPLGILDQQWWNRPEEKTPSGKNDPRAREEREYWAWIRCMEAATEQLRPVAPHTRPWFKMDRGADFWAVFEAADRLDVDLTVRAVHSRVVTKGNHTSGLWNTVARAPVLGILEVTIPAGHSRVSRVARFEVRAGTYRVRLRANPSPQMWKALGAIRIRELGLVPFGEERIEWKLLTNVAVSDLQDARQVVAGYALRWRIEEFHKTWKSGCCDLESSQLRSFDAIVRWGTQFKKELAAVATRVERLKLRSRTQPDIDARSEFTQVEIDAAIILTTTKKYSIGAQMTVKEAVRLVAMAGGFMGRKGDGDPGSVTITRGLESVLPAAAALDAVRTCG